MPFELLKIDLGYGKSSCVLEPADPLKQFVSLKDDPIVEKMLAILEDDFGPDGARATPWQKSCEKAKVPHKTFYRRRKELLEAYPQHQTYRGPRWTSVRDPKQTYGR